MPTRRVYALLLAEGGLSILVDRLWPSGVAKGDGRVALWLRDVAPTAALRRQFHRNLTQCDAFVAAYATELAAPPASEAVERLRQPMRDEPVTLVYASRDEQHNNAVTLRSWLESH